MCAQSEEACVSYKISFTALFDQTFMKNTGLGKSKNTAEFDAVIPPTAIVWCLCKLVICAVIKYNYEGRLVY